MAARPQELLLQQATLVRFEEFCEDCRPARFRLDFCRLFDCAKLRFCGTVSMGPRRLWDFSSPDSDIWDIARG